LNRNLRTSVYIFSAILVTLLAVATAGWTFVPAYAAEETVETPVVPESTHAPEEPPTAEPTEAPPAEAPTNAPTDEPTIDAPTPEPATDIPSTDVPTIDAPTDEATIDAPTEEATTDVTPTAAAEETVEPELTAEATEEATETAIAPEETLEPEATAEVTETPIPVEPEFEVTLSCSENGVEFVITNTGADMEAASSFTLQLDDEANAAAPTPPTDLPDSTFPIEFTLLAGEFTTVKAGYGLPQIVLDGVPYYPETPCLPPTPPVIEVSAVCAFETGVTFTILNTGGAMTAEQGYTISNLDEQANSTFILGTNESVSVAAGYGLPTLTTGEVVSGLAETCFAPTSISGTIWDDMNEDAVRGGDEIGMSGVGVSLIDTTGTALYAISDADGNYNFANIPVATYTISVDLTTLSSDYHVSFPESTTVNFQAYETNTPIDFGFTAQPTASITGTVWMDSTNYGVRDADETGIAGVLVELVDATGTVVATTPIDALTGTYVFVNLFSGDYTVRLDQNTVFQPNAVSFNSDSTIDYETPIKLTSGEALANIDFGLVGTY